MISALYIFQIGVVAPAVMDFGQNGMPRDALSRYMYFLSSTEHPVDDRRSVSTSSRYERHRVAMETE